MTMEEMTFTSVATVS